MKADMTFDIHYGYWFNLACERFYKHIDVALNFVQLVGGSGAALAALNNSPTFVVAAGVALAICAALSLLVQPSVKAEQHLQAKCRWLALKPKALVLPDAELAVLVAEEQASGPAGVGALAVPAFNLAVCATGREDRKRPEGLLEKLASAIA